MPATLATPPTENDMQQQPTVIDLNIDNAEHVVIRVNGMTYARVLLGIWEGRDELKRKVELAEKITATIPPLLELKKQISGYQEVRRLLAEGPSTKRLAVLRGVIDGLDNRDPEHDAARFSDEVGPENPAYEYDRGYRYGMGITRYMLAVAKRYRDYQEANEERPRIVTTPEEIKDAALALIAQGKVKADVPPVGTPECESKRENKD